MHRSGAVTSPALAEMSSRQQRSKTALASKPSAQTPTDVAHIEAELKALDKDVAQFAALQARVDAMADAEGDMLDALRERVQEVHADQSERYRAAFERTSARAAAEFDAEMAATFAPEHEAAVAADALLHRADTALAASNPRYNRIRQVADWLFAAWGALVLRVLLWIAGVPAPASTSAGVTSASASASAGGSAASQRGRADSTLHQPAAAAAAAEHSPLQRQSSTSTSTNSSGGLRRRAGSQS